MSVELILIIVVLVLLFGGGGYFGRTRGYWWAAEGAAHRWFRQHAASKGLRKLQITSTRRRIMSLGLLFWILMLLSVLFGWWHWQGRAGHYGPVGVNLLLLVLLALLGWKVFGAPIHGW
jgi:hypothetical protein